MWKRNLLRRVPGLSRIAEALDHYQRRNAELAVEVKHLQKLLYQVLFANDTSLVEEGLPDSLARHADLPVPSRALRFLVAGTEDLGPFLQGGQLGVQSLIDVLARQGQTLDRFKSILDFGCGCGRVLRHLLGVATASIHGCDSNPLAIQWCARYLNFAQFRVNSLEPPLPYDGGMFDLIYAFSVFTHLTEPMQARWMAELRRVLSTGGWLVITVHGDKFADSLPQTERRDYFQGKLVVQEPDVAGTNYCNSFHPQAYVRNVLARDFDVLEFIPEGAKGNPPQDLYLMRARPN